MPLILDAFWTATLVAARVFSTPMEVFVCLMTLPMLSTGTRRSKGQKHNGRGRRGS